MDLSIQYTQELQSKEGQEILNALKSKMHILEEALDLNNLIPEIRSLSEKDFFKSPILRSELRLINEAEAAELEAAAVSGDEAAIDNVLANSGGLPSPSGGILSMLKSLLSTLTEGGSPIGILHLVLDFIGLVGDAFLVVGIPLGMVADCINGIIYMFRGKWILGLISLIAMIPFGGDVAKGFKGVAHTFSKPFSKLATKGAGKGIAKESAEVLMKQEGKAFGKSKRFLEYIKKSAAKVASSISSAVSFLLKDVIGKAVGWVPFIGKPLRRFFTKIANFAKNIADNLLVFSKTVDAPIAKAISKKAAKNFKYMDEALAAGGKVVKEGEKLVIKKGGKVVKKIPIEDLAKYSNISKKFPDGPMSKILKNSDDVADFYTFVSQRGGAARAFLTRNKNVLILRGLGLGKFGSFIAKQIVKLLGSSANALSDFEREGMSDIITTQELNDRMEEHAQNEKERKGSVIDVPYIDQQLKDRPETELDEGDLVYDLQRHLDYNAKRMGLPSFPSYIYARAKEENEQEMIDVYTEHAISDEEYNKIMGIQNSGAKALESKQYSKNLKYIKPFTL
tara:strand:- start:2001 stop:3695 length:1695 start_codon:yes stop_codon:yes gene_type:complete